MDLHRTASHRHTGDVRGNNQDHKASRSCLLRASRDFFIIRPPPMGMEGHFIPRPVWTMHSLESASIGRP